VEQAIRSAEAVIICPSNPWVSIDPILRVLSPILSNKLPIVAVSPIIGGKTVKGPAAKMFTELGITPSALAVAKHYQDILRGFVLDSQDAHLAESLPVRTLITNTLMRTNEDRAKLAQDVLHFAGKLT
jgi:LPPG:FO 2-phospho-L-lactate transferase